MKRVGPLEKENIPAAIESILFVANEPVALTVLAQSLRYPIEGVEAALVTLAEVLADRGIQLQRTGDQIQLASAPEWGPYVERFLGLESRQRMSGAALESLAIVAYKQPITRAGVEAVRGVNSDGAIASLITRGLVEEIGRAPTPGRPALFGTTLKFLEHFGLNHPSELPALFGDTVESFVGALDQDVDGDEVDDYEEEDGIEAETSGAQP
jgi:segregation and condensation protein B